MAWLTLSSGDASAQPAWIPNPPPPNVQIADESLYVTNPGAARNAFAALYTDDHCSGVMISPTVYMTAAHCFGGVPNNLDITIRGRVYNPDSSSGFESRPWACEQLLTTDNDTDMALFFCDPERNGGERPGDVHGFADVAWWTPAHSSTDPLYSVFRANFGNPLIDVNGGFFATGNVQGFSDYDPNNALVGYGHPGTTVNQPLCVTGHPGNVNRNQLRREVNSNIYNLKGASGSSTFDADNHLLVLGPTTGMDPDAPVWPGGGRYSKQQLPWFSYMTDAWLPDAVADVAPANGVIDAKWCFGSGWPATNDDVFADLSLNAADYRGKKLDTRGNLFVDAVEDVDRSLGDPPRDYTFPFFGSIRTNVQWALSNANINVASEALYLDGGSSVARWRPMTPEANEPYVLSFDIKTQGASGSKSVWCGVQKFWRESSRISGGCFWA